MTLKKRTRKVKIPIGIEKVLCRAAGDRGFRKALFDDRGAALARLGEEVTEAELGILTSIPGEILSSMIRRIDLRRHSRRRFMRGIVAATFVAGSATVAVQCDTKEEAADQIKPGTMDATGVRPDDPTDAYVPDAYSRGIDIDEPLWDIEADGVGVDEILPELGITADEVLGSDDTQGGNEIVGQPDVIDAEEVIYDTGIGPDVF